MKNIFLLITMIILSGLYIRAQETIAEPPSNFNHPYAGTEFYPYFISSLANLRWLSETPDVWGSYGPSLEWPYHDVLIKKYFCQTADIDATETINWNEGQGFIPIGAAWDIHGYDDGHGYSNTPFYGDYSGNNYTINNLYINTHRDSLALGDYYVSTAGLFGHIERALVSNLHLVNVNITGNVRVGAIAGNAHRSKIYNCSSSGVITFNKTPYVSGAQSSARVGGIAGTATYIENCGTTVNISLNWLNTATSQIAGVVGSYDYQELTEQPYLKNSYFNGHISKTFEYVPSFSGLLHNSGPNPVSYSYVTDNFSPSLIGRVTFGTNLSNTIWNYETTNIPNTPISATVFGRSTEEMKWGGTYIFNGWDFSNIWAIDSEINDGYPYLKTRYLKPPQNLQWETQGDELTLTWDAPELGPLGPVQSYKISAYYIYLNTHFIHHGEFEIGSTNDLTFTYNDLEWITFFNFRVKALYGWNGLESPSASAFDNLNCEVDPNEIFIYPVYDMPSSHPNLRIHWYPSNETPSYLRVHKNGYAGDIIQPGVSYLFAYDTGYLEYIIFPTSQSENFAPFSIKVFVDRNNPPPQLALSATISDSIVLLNWDYSFISNTVTYKIYRDGTFLAEQTYWHQSYIDTDVVEGVHEYLILVQHNKASASIATVSVSIENVQDIDIILPEFETALQGNYPNPFNPETTISFSLATKGTVSLEIFNIKGQKVKTLLDEVREAGKHTITWNGIDDSGLSVGSGIYFYRMSTDSYSTVKKMVLMK
ncbi:MAG: T9SS type A sorting domain-containing protein [Candidatus Cloacimonetes bacterium]|nr:T9SS type A sorting domain-containing protein [Candidatus Cloacimonadota bacterium]